MDTTSTTVARIYNSLAQAHESQQNIRAALNHYKTAHSILLSAYGKPSESSALIAYNIGVTFDKLAANDSALFWKKEAMETLIQATGEKTIDLADIYTSLGVTYDNQRDHENALLFYQKALAIQTEIRGDKHPALADLYNKMGVAYESKGDNNNAMRYKSFALKLRESSGDPLVVESYLNIGVGLANQGKFSEALENYNRALNIQRQRQDRLGLALTYSNIGNIYFEQGSLKRTGGRYDKRDLDSAVKYHQESLDIRREILGDKHPDVSYSYYNLGIAHFKLGEAFRPALEAFQNALISSVEDFNNPSFASNPKLDRVISENRLLMALEGKAKATYNLARSEDAKQIGSKRYISALSASYQTYELATQLILQMRQSLLSDEAKIDLAERSFSIFEDALQMALTLHNAGL